MEISGDMDLANAITTQIKHLQKHNQNLQQDVKHLRAQLNNLQCKNEELLQERELLKEQLINQSQQIQQVSGFIDTMKATINEQQTIGVPTSLIIVMIDTIKSTLKGNNQ